MPDSRTPEIAQAPSHAAAVVTLSREQLRVNTEWVAAGHVRFRRHVVSETRMIELTVRREELVVETDAAVSPTGVIAGLGNNGEPIAAPELGQAPMVFVLREEIPEVVTRVRAYERVTAHVDIANTVQQVSGNVRAELADLVIEPPAEEHGGGVADPVEKFL